MNDFEYGIKLNTTAASGRAFINGNNFSNLILGENIKYDIYLTTNGNSSSEVSGNNFTNVQTHYAAGKEKHIFLDSNSHYNHFSNIMGYNAISAAKLLFEIQGRQNTVLGSIPTSGGIASFSANTNRFMQTDSGNQTNLLQLGERIIENSRYKHKTNIFTTSDLPHLDVRDGEVLIANNVVFGTRLTRVIQGQNGQTIKIKFDGNTLLSNRWGGIGQFQLAGNASYYPADGHIKSFTFIDGIWYEGS